MLKLRLQCTGKTPYDSNQQLSLQATINPSALFIKLYATSEVPERPARGGLDRSGEAEPSLTPSVTPVMSVPRVPACSQTSKFSRGQDRRETPDRTLNMRRVSALYHLPPPPV